MCKYKFSNFIFTSTRDITKLHNKMLVKTEMLQKQINLKSRFFFTHACDRDREIINLTMWLLRSRGKKAWRILKFAYFFAHVESINLYHTVFYGIRNVVFKVRNECNAQFVLLPESHGKPYFAKKTVSGVRIQEIWKPFKHINKDPSKLFAVGKSD